MSRLNSMGYKLKQFIFLQSLLWTMFSWQICLLCPITSWTILRILRSFSTIKIQSSLKLKCCVWFKSHPLLPPPFPPSSSARLVTQGIQSDHFQPTRVAVDPLVYLSLICPHHHLRSAKSKELECGGANGCCYWCRGLFISKGVSNKIMEMCCLRLWKKQASQFYR